MVASLSISLSDKTEEDLSLFVVGIFFVDSFPLLYTSFSSLAPMVFSIIG